MIAQTQAVPAATRNNAIVPALIAITLGLFFLLGTAFVQADALHNGAHDARHAFSFPCH